MIEVKPVAWRQVYLQDGKETADTFCDFEPFHGEIDESGAEVRAVALYDQSTIDALQARIAALEFKTKYPKTYALLGKVMSGGSDAAK